MLQREVTDAQPDLLRRRDHLLGTAEDILRLVLVVAVGGDNAVDALPVFEAPGKGGLQRTPLALVDLVGENGDLRMLRGVQKGLEMILVTAVVDQNDVAEAHAQQPFHNLHQLFVGIQRGDDYGYVHISAFLLRRRTVRRCRSRCRCP